MSSVCPCIAGASIRAGSGPSVSINDPAVDTINIAVDEDGDVVDEIDGIMIEFWAACMQHSQTPRPPKQQTLHVFFGTIYGAGNVALPPSCRKLCVSRKQGASIVCRALIDSKEVVAT